MSENLQLSDLIKTLKYFSVLTETFSLLENVAKIEQNVIKKTALVTFIAVILKMTEILLKIQLSLKLFQITGN
jgi:hypothetical protein